VSELLAMDLERLPMFGFVVDRCEACDEYRAGLQLVYETHYGGYWDPPDYTERWICERCIEWRELGERAGELGSWAMHVMDLEEADDPTAPTGITTRLFGSTQSRSRKSSRATARARARLS
jgi:hypothetical protein